MREWLSEESLISLGMLSLVVSILLNRYGQGIPHLAFFEGLFLGLSVTFNLAYLVKNRRSPRFRVHKARNGR